VKLDFHFRRSEIIVIARRKDVADTDDLDRFLIAWFWHRPTSADKDPIGSLISVAWRMGRHNFMPSEAEEIIQRSKRGRPLYKADDLGEYLRLTDAERTAWGIKTIGGYDLPKRQRAARRKRLDRERKARRRREAGATPRSSSLANTQPWLAERISRRTWFRRQRGTNGTNSSALGTVSSAVPFFVSKDETVPITTRTHPGQVLPREIMLTDWMTAPRRSDPEKESKGTAEGSLLIERSKPAAKVTWRDKRLAPFTC
jgi:hypothetical protein